MKKHTYLIIFTIIIFFYLLALILFAIFLHQSPSTIFESILNPIQISDEAPSCIPRKMIEPEVKFYNLSSDHSYHYEYRYELNPRNISSNDSRLILLLTGQNRACIDWWNFSIGENILSPMRSAGFSILAICTPRKNYQIRMPVQENLDAYWIYTILQIWMKEIYYKTFQHYPRLYLFGISQGSRMSALLCRVLPIQAQVLYIYPGYRPSLMINSAHTKAMQTRLITDFTFANWFYFDYCSKGNLNTSKPCPFHHNYRNYFNPVPPTYFLHVKNDELVNLSDYTDLILDLRGNASDLGGTFLTREDTIILYVASPLNITSDYMKENFRQWFCKPWSSRFFYEHFTNPLYDSRKKELRTCWCTPTNFLYFEQYPNITQTWPQTKQDEYQDYIEDIKRFNVDFCETVCGNILAQHAMSSHNIDNILHWFNDMDHYRFLYRIEEFLHRPLRLWMYNKSDLVQNRTYLTYQTSRNSSCGRYYHANQMYSPEYFLYNYFRRLKNSYPFARHNLVWTKNPLLADYYIIPHDYVCIATDYYQPTLTDSEYRSFYIHLNENYFSPLLTNIRTHFPYWNMTSGSNHIIPFTIGKNMGVIQNKHLLDILKPVIQLAFSGFRQDLLPRHSPPLYIHRNVTTIYRHNYDILVPAFNRLQWVNDRPIIHSDVNRWYQMKKRLLFFAGTVNNSNSVQSVRRDLSLLIKNDIGKGKRYENEITIDGKEFDTMLFTDGLLSSVDYVDSIRSSIFNLCPEGFSPWSPRLYESICLGTIPLILAGNIVLPFERFIDWRSLSTRIDVNNVRNLIDCIRKIDHFEDYVKEKLQNVTQYFHAFRWPYSPINHHSDRHLFLPEEDMNEKAKNVFHYLSLELRCRRLEQFYGLTFESLTIESINAKRQACRKHTTICPCYEEKKSLALEEYI